MSDDASRQAGTDLRQSFQFMLRGVVHVDHKAGRGHLRGLSTWPLGLELGQRRGRAGQAAEALLRGGQ